MPSLEELIVALKDEDPKVRADAAEEIGKLGPAAHPAIEPLLLNLFDEDHSVKFEAGEALLKIGDLAIEPLTEVLSKNPDKVALKTVIILGRFEDAATASLLKLLSHKDQRLRENIIRALGFIKPVNGSIVYALLKIVSGNESSERMHARVSLAGLKEGAIDFLIQALSDPNAGIRSSAAQALADIASHPYKISSSSDYVPSYQPDEELLKKLATMVPNLIKTLADSDAAVRANAAKALGEIGRAASAAENSLIQALSDADGEVRANAAKALGNIGVSDETAVANLLIKALQDDAPRVRWAAAEALGNLGSAAKSAVPPIIPLLSDDLPGVRLGAAIALIRLDAADASVKEMLIQFISNDELSISISTIVMLGELGPVAKFAVEPIVQVFPKIRKTEWDFVAKALGNIGDERALPVLEEVIQNSPNSHHPNLDGIRWAIEQIKQRNKE